MGGRTLPGELGDYLADPQTRRTWALAAQDGIISTAGILLGFTGAGADQATLVVAGTAAIVAGMLTAGGAKWSETAAEREAQLRAIDEERLVIRQERGTVREELVANYEEKGLDTELAELVADELMIRSPLKAALESEHGILRLISRAEVVISGLGSALAYGLGAVVPFAIAYYLPVSIEVWVIVFSVLVSLSLISVVGARAGRMDVSRTILRTLIVGSVTIIVSYLVGTAGVSI
jgi:VIT1/CCC1 family predicted Fe2+/Mn2+ transporter